MRENVANLVRLMLVTDDRMVQGRDLIELVRAAERGGVTSVQLRLKERGAREISELVRTLTAQLRVPLLVNDRPDIAIAAGAAGVHLGPDDLPVSLARKIAPAGFLIGASVGSAEEAAAAEEADYWGIGPWRVTPTKTDSGPALGPAAFSRLVGLARGKPAIAIGGVTPGDIAEVLAGGGRGVAVVSGILGAEDVEDAARQYSNILSRLLE
jgi:thiamine-phosphate pyrophosphorylase